MKYRQKIAVLHATLSICDNDLIKTLNLYKMKAFAVNPYFTIPLCEIYNSA